MRKHKTNFGIAKIRLKPMSKNVWVFSLTWRVVTAAVFAGTQSVGHVWLFGIHLIPCGRTHENKHAHQPGLTKKLQCNHLTVNIYSCHQIQNQ